MSDLKVNKDQANQAFNTVVQAISAAMQGKFPVGIDNIEIHMEIKGSLSMIGQALKDLYGESAPSPVVASDVATEPEKESD